MTSQALISKIHCTHSANQKEIVSQSIIIFHTGVLLAVGYEPTPGVFLCECMLSKYSCFDKDCPTKA